MLSHSRPYGVADAMDVALARARRHAEDREREQVAVEVRDAIARSGLSRSEFHAVLELLQGLLTTGKPSSHHALGPAKGPLL